MKLLSIEQYIEMNETFVFTKSCPELDNYTMAEWIKAYMYIIAPAGVDTLCESDDNMTFKILLSENNGIINEGLFKDIKNVLKGRKLVKAKYKGYDQAAKNYIQKSKSISDSDKQSDIKDKQRIALKKSYDASIKSIDDKVKGKLDSLKSESPVVAKYEKFAKLKYQLSLIKLNKKFGVSMANVKAYNSEISDIKKEIGEIASEIANVEKEVKKETKKEEPKKAEDTKKEEPKSLTKSAEDDPRSKLEADIKGYNDAAKKAADEITKSQEKIKEYEDKKANATDPEKFNDLIAKEKQLIDDNKEDIAELKSDEKKAKAELKKIGESLHKTIGIKSLKEFLNAL